jgi:hypothetical protein
MPDSCCWGAATTAATGDDDEGPGCICGDGGGGAAGCTDVEGPASSVLRRFRRDDDGDGELPDGPSASCSQVEPVSLSALLLVLGSGWTSRGGGCSGAGCCCAISGCGGGGVGASVCLLWRCGWEGSCAMGLRALLLRQGGRSNGDDDCFC